MSTHRHWKTPVWMGHGYLLHNGNEFPMTAIALTEVPGCSWGELAWINCDKGHQELGVARDLPAEETRKEERVEEGHAHSERPPDSDCCLPTP